MPTVTALSLIQRAQILAQDPDGVRTPQSEWLGWLNDGQREVVTVKPTANSITADRQLAAGSRQSLPADGIQLIDYLVSVDGTSPTTAPRKIRRLVIDSFAPGWQAERQRRSPQHYVFDPVDSTAFFVHPPSDGVAKARILYAAQPAAVAAVGDVIGLADFYANALLDYMMYRQCGKDAEFVGNAERSVLYRKSFENSLGLRGNSDAELARANKDLG